MPGWLKRTLVFVAIVAGILVITWVVLDVWFMDRVTVANNSMAPTILAGDIVLMWKDAEIEQNDVVLCRNPRDPNRYVLGRVIATPGMKIGFERGQLLINDHRIAFDFRGERHLADVSAGRNDRWARGWEELGDYRSHWFLSDPRRPVVMPSKTVRSGLFLLSDFRSFRGEDSRAYGEVDPSTCLGQIFMVFWPTETAGADFPASERRFHLID